MPCIFDNIDQPLLLALQQTLEAATHADFCVGYFNLRGWRGLGSYFENWNGGEGECCRLLVGMQRLPQEELREAKRLTKQNSGIDNQTALRLKQRLAEEFREQLTVGVPTREDERGLRQLARQLREEKVQVKLFLRHTLHAKLYLIYRSDVIAPTVGYHGTWDPEKDAKLNALEALLTETHRDDKVLVFTQFADTVQYLTNALSERGLTDIAAATGDSADPTKLAWRFSPVSNNKQDSINPEAELRGLIDLWQTDRLCIVEDAQQTREPQIICSLGLRTKGF